MFKTQAFSCFSPDLRTALYIRLKLLSLTNPLSLFYIRSYDASEEGMSQEEEKSQIDVRMKNADAVLSP
jgi:hypothetical protein